MIKILSAFKNDAGFADMFDEMLLINQSKVSHSRTLVPFWNTPRTDFPYNIEGVLLYCTNVLPLNFRLILISLLSDITL